MHASVGWRARVWLGAAAILVTILLVCNILLISGKVAPIWDAVSQFSPWFSLICDHARHGRVLLWNPWIDGGSPDFAEPEAGAASPVVILFGLIFSDPFRAFIAYWLGIWIFGGIGMLLLCKHLNCPPWGCIVVSLSFVANGFYTGHAEHMSMLYSYSFLPWMLWRFDLGLIERRQRYFIESGALWGLSALGGYPQLTILQPVFLFLWALGRLFASRDHIGWHPKISSSAKFLVFALIIFGLVGAAIMSPTYVAFLTESHGYSARANILPRDYALTSNLFPPGALSTFASPVLYLLELPPTIRWPDTDVSMVNFYLGAITSMLAIVALLKASGMRLWIVCIGAMFMSCAVGKYLPVRGWLYDLVPVTRFFRHPALFSCFTIFAIAVLAALATRDIDAENTEKGSKQQRGEFLAVSLLLLPIAYLSFRQLSMNQGQIVHPLYASVHFWIVWLGIAAIFLAWCCSAIYPRDLCWALITLCIFDATSTLYLSSSSLYSNASLPWWDVMRAKHTSNLQLGEQGVSRNLHPPPELADFYPHDRNVAIKDPELANLTPLTSTVFERYVADPLLYRMAIGPNRMWFSSTPLWCPPDQKTFEQFQSVSHTVPTPPMILHSRNEMISDFARSTSMQNGTKSCIGQSPAPMPAAVKILKYAPNQLSLSYTSDQGGWLMITDRWARSWEASVNGKATPIAGADFLFRAVPVTAGENIISMSYKPRTYILLIILSWGTLAIILFWEAQHFLRGLLTTSKTTRDDMRDIVNLPISRREDNAADIRA